MVLMMKLFLFAITFGLLLVHDFILDPYGPPPKSTVENPTSFIRADLVQKGTLIMAFLVLLSAAYLASM